MEATLALTGLLALSKFQSEMLAIGLLLVVVTIVVMRLPKVEVDHSPAFKRRRLLNWLPLGLTYAFLYMGRYNLKVAHYAFQKIPAADGSPIMTNQGFAAIFAVGTAVYGASFLFNGPLTDKHGGKKAILVGAGGSLVMNFLMGVASLAIVKDWASAGFLKDHFKVVFSALYGLNMYFQSFGAVAIVKCNAPWFHVRERGVFGAIFGILISLGIYFAFDVSTRIKDLTALGDYSLPAVFFAPALALAIFWVLDVLLVQNTPAEAGLNDFDTADASSGDEGPQLGAVEVFKKMLANPIIVTIALVEFCSGFLRQAIMQWGRTFAKQTDSVLHLYKLEGLQGDVGFFQGISPWIMEHWGMVLCCAGIMGGVFAGTISDHLFNSRRGPVASVLYAAMLALAGALVFLYAGPALGVILALMSMCVIGVHGMLSGTASMDFGGKKNVGVAVGIIDGFVYAGTACMALLYGAILPKEQLDPVTKQLIGPATDPANWKWWPIAMVPVAAIGLVLALRVWNAKPKGKASTSK